MKNKLVRTGTSSRNLSRWAVVTKFIEQLTNESKFGGLNQVAADTGRNMLKEKNQVYQWLQEK